ncbi:phosphatase PAP2 family protein [Streptomyces sp. NPDC051001]|uniref:phosphatase PAP2 family protein n=1 Tax=Streptomyces sp. NPDC051001 TaxID=3155795 RepID=UPI00342EDDB3
MWWTAIRRKDTQGIAGSVLTGLGTVVAYAVSEAVKLVVDEERPCRALRAGVASVAECPGVGDWSFPSNHATLAAGLAVGLAVLRPRLTAITLPLAGAAALLRVLVGVHYPHDVLASGAVVAGRADRSRLNGTAWPTPEHGEISRRPPAPRAPVGSGSPPTTPDPLAASYPCLADVQRIRR